MVRLTETRYETANEPADRRRVRLVPKLQPSDQHGSDRLRHGAQPQRRSRVSGQGPPGSLRASGSRYNPPDLRHLAGSIRSLFIA